MDLAEYATIGSFLLSFLALAQPQTERTDGRTGGGLCSHGRKRRLEDKCFFSRPCEVNQDSGPVEMLSVCGTIRSVSKRRLEILNRGGGVVAARGHFPADIPHAHPVITKRQMIPGGDDGTSVR